MNPTDRTPLDLSATLRLHSSIAEACRAQPARLERCCASANDRLISAGVGFEKGRAMPVAPSALLLSNHDADQLAAVAEQLWRLVEKVLDLVLGDQRLLKTHFSDHARVFDYLIRTRGQNNWQVLSRFDAVVTPEGRLQFVELNTACPAGFSDMSLIADVTAGLLEGLDLADPFSFSRSVTIARDAFWEKLLEVERQSGVEPGCVAVLNDENALTHELDLLAAGFRVRGRESVVADAAELEHSGGRLMLGGRPISLTFNKFRVSTEHSPNHCWKAGFETRYRAFLQGLREQSFVPVNNLVGLTLAEDKGLLAVLRDPEVQARLTESDRSFIDLHIPWTTRLGTPEVSWDGRTRPLEELLRVHPEQFVVKPANEGRGFGVTLGRHASADDWASACRGSPRMPAIVQTYVPCLMLPVCCLTPDRMEVRPMHTTLSFGLISGRFVGFMSRISPSPVANVARQGFNQPVFQL